MYYQSKIQLTFLLKARLLVRSQKHSYDGMDLPDLKILAKLVSSSDYTKDYKAILLLYFMKYIASVISYNTNQDEQYTICKLHR